MSSNSITYRTLEQLDGENWGEPGFDSFLVKRTHALRKIPLNKFTAEDLRLMIGQGFGLNYLMPIALDVLSENLMAEGDYYPGDLLQSVFKTDVKFWLNNKDFWLKINALVEAGKDELAENQIDFTQFQNMFSDKK